MSTPAVAAAPSFRRVERSSSATRTELTSEQVRNLLGDQYRDGDENRVLDFVGSDESIDRYRTVLKVDGWELDSFMKNPVILLNHDYNELPIGKAINVRTNVAKKQLIFSVLFARDERSERVFQMYNNRFMHGVSVGFIVKGSEEPDEELSNKGCRAVYTKMELLELSCVTVPANPNALEESFSRGFLVSADMTPQTVSFLTLNNMVECLSIIEGELTRSQLIRQDSGWLYRLKDAEDFETDSIREVEWRDVDAPHAVVLLVGRLGSPEGPEEEPTDPIQSGVAADSGIPQEERSPACRKKGETKSDCVSRKVPEILEENPDMENDQAVAIAESVCSKACGENSCTADVTRQSKTEEVVGILFKSSDGWEEESVIKWLEKNMDDILSIKLPEEEAQNSVEEVSTSVDSSIDLVELLLAFEENSRKLDSLVEEIRQLRQQLSGSFQKSLKPSDEDAITDSLLELRSWIDRRASQS